MTWENYENGYKFITAFQLRHENWTEFPTFNIWLDTKKNVLILDTVIEVKKEEFQHGYWYNRKRGKNEIELRNALSNMDKYFHTEIEYAEKTSNKQKALYPELDRIGIFLVSPFYYIAAGDEGEEVLVTFSRKYPDGVYTINGSYFSSGDDLDKSPSRGKRKRIKNLEDAFNKFSQLNNGLILIYENDLGNKYTSSWVADFWTLGFLKLIYEKLVNQYEISKKE
jgi:hypothetical protein